MKDDPDYVPGEKRKANVQGCNIPRRNKCRICGMWKAGHTCPGYFITKTGDDDNKSTHVNIEDKISLPNTRQIQVDTHSIVSNSAARLAATDEAKKAANEAARLAAAEAARLAAAEEAKKAADEAARLAEMSFGSVGAGGGGGFGAVAAAGGSGFGAAAAGTPAPATTPFGSGTPFGGGEEAKKAQAPVPVAHNWQYEDGHCFDMHSNTWLYQTSPSYVPKWTNYDDATKAVLDEYVKRSMPDAGTSMHIATSRGMYCINWCTGEQHAAIQKNEKTGYERRVRMCDDRSVTTAASNSLSAAVVTFADISLAKKAYPRPSNMPLINFDPDLTGGYDKSDRCKMPNYWLMRAQQWQWLPLDGSIAKEVSYWYRHTLCSSTHNYYIYGIEMNVDMDNFEMYQMKKRSLIKKGIAPNERWAWHGTDAVNTSKIKQNGFDRDFSRNGNQAYGVGTYFAKNSNYSWTNGYCRINTMPDGTKQHFIILSRVLLGDYCKGNTGCFLKDMPKKKDGTQYNSMVGFNLETPTIYVLGGGSDNQVYPEFVLEFREKV